MTESDRRAAREWAKGYSFATPQSFRADLAEAYAAGLALGRAKLAAELDGRADLYEKDGEPGELGFNFWGWRDFARTLRDLAAAVRKGDSP